MLNNKLVLVTGGGSGIGRACCILSAEEGATVIVTDINDTTAKETVQQIRGDSHCALHVDVSKSASVTKLAHEVVQKYSRLPDAVIHCAGIELNRDGIEGCTEDVWDGVMAVNLKGTYLVNRTFGLLMKERKQRGSLVNISSVCSMGVPWALAYAATKAAQIGFTKSVAKEWAPFGIRVNCIRPGYIENTSIGADLGKKELKLDIPMGRPGQPMEVAQVAVFLASDRSSNVTSTEYDVHGGLEMVLHKCWE